MKIYFTFLLIVLNIQIANATVRNVPATYTSIQVALNSCVSYDTVLVQPVIYYENIIWPNPNIKGLSLIGSGGSGMTIIDGSHLNRVLTIDGKYFPDSSITISGFTIQNGLIFDTTGSSDELFGAGIYIDSSIVSLTDLIVNNNSVEGVGYTWGGGLYAYYSFIFLSDCSLSNNRIISNSYAYGAGIYAERCSTFVDHSTINLNSSYSPYWDRGAGISIIGGYFSIVTSQMSYNSLDTGSTWSFGGGMWLFEADANIQNCLLSDNHCDMFTSHHGGHSIYFNTTGLPRHLNIDHCTITGDHTGTYDLIFIDDLSGGGSQSLSIKNSIVWGSQIVPIEPSNNSIIVENCDIEGSTFGGINSFSLDPAFISSSDHHIQPFSPCINHGIPTTNIDLDGNIRPSPQWHNPDIGCYEVDESIYGHLISGHTFIDSNNNGVFDSTDFPYSNIEVNINVNQVTVLANNGSYSVLLPDQGYLVNATIPSGMHLTTNPSVYNVTLNGSDVSNIDFGFYPDSSQLNNLDAFILGGLPRCNSSVSYTISCINTGIQPANGIIELVSDTLMSFISSSPIPDSINGNIYFWHYSGLNPFAMQNLVLMNFMLPGAGNLLQNNINISSFDSSNVILASSGNSLSQLVICPLDPNHKMVNPAETITTLPTDWLTFTIFFQNTGSDTAINVEIIDTLDALFNIQTLEIIHSTHNYSVTVDTNRVMDFSFPNIYLPDSNVNQMESEGYITYRIKLASGISNNVTVSNIAYIYFDRNSAISTNTTESLIFDPTVNLGNPVRHESEIYLSPNPFSYSTIIKLPLSVYQEPYHVILSDFQGNKIKDLGWIYSEEYKFEKGSIHSGMYLLQFEGEKSHRKMSAKLLIID